MRTVGAWVAVAALGWASATHAQGSDRPIRGLSAGESFLYQERAIWTLQNRLLREALNSVRDMAESGRAITEGQLQSAIRRGRSENTLREARYFIEDYLDTETRNLLADIADANRLKPEDVLADYLTVEATIDFSLMASAYNTFNGNNFARFPEEAQRKIRELVGELRKAPVPSDQIVAGRIDRGQLIINAFGCEIRERIVSESPEDRRGGKATVRWRSNYSFLRDIKERKAPDDEREDVLTMEGERWRTSYRREFEEFVDGSARSEWGRKIREMLDMDGYLARRDPLDERKDRRSRYAYVPAADGDSPARFTGGRDDRDLDDRRRDERNRDRDRRDDRP
jgi:hypothetical protein